MSNTLRIAFYGKGGIGKSTIAGNFSAEMGKAGFRVLHIGCDPKADSARLLTGRKIPSVLERMTALCEPKREDILFLGDFGVWCAEAGGPKAGTGCAGLGITVTVEKLRELGIMDENWDMIVYDVLGDVVCGGFAVPMKQRLADKVCIVTSGDYMSLYAANNILKGIAGIAGQRPLFGGFIHNHCHGEREEEIVKRYSKQAAGKVLGVIHESQAIKRADFSGKSLLSSCLGHKAQFEMRETAEEIRRTQPVCPKPLTEEEMELFRREIYKMDWYEGEEL